MSHWLPRSLCWSGWMCLAWFISFISTTSVDQIRTAPNNWKCLLTTGLMFVIGVDKAGLRFLDSTPLVVCLRPWSVKRCEPSLAASEFRGLFLHQSSLTLWVGSPRISPKCGVRGLFVVQRYNHVSQIWGEIDWLQPLRPTRSTPRFNENCSFWCDLKVCMHQYSSVLIARSEWHFVNPASYSSLLSYGVASGASR